MAKTLERYQRCSYGAAEQNQSSQDTQSNYQEYLKLKARVEVLQQSQRHLLGEDLSQLGTKELDQLERQLDASLKQIRSTKTQYMLDQLSDLHQKEQALLEVNRTLRIKLEESNAAFQLSWESEEQRLQQRVEQPIQPEGFFQPLDQGNNPMHIDYNNMVASEHVAGPARNASGILPGRMF